MPRRTAARLLIWVPYIALSVIHVIALATESDLAAPTKMTLMPLLALPVLFEAPRLRPRSVLALLLAALLFSWFGDEAGAFFPWGPELPLMLLFFGIAHVAYIVLFAKYLRVRRIPWWTLIYAVWWVGMLVILGPSIGALIFAVAAYGLVLAGTATMAARCHRLITVGGVFFLTSDSILAFRLFLPDAMPQWTSPAVMLTYTLGQGLIVAGALIAARSRRES
ncbi:MULTISPECIES: lysoplasmalogenase [unclassified Microbacterium]|uniref:lysoplasmalogenase n=1 Tax=unclassified Microbacterium TaxID=2609290 RepID=UPI0012F8C629|nr:lysoplasmalogenase [Microbacterium sp. MAH-37]MVQ43289.1 lysoplasmalogenase [Microbacterium sp. MAH-37]